MEVVEEGEKEEMMETIDSLEYPGAGERTPLNSPKECLEYWNSSFKQVTPLV